MKKLRELERRAAEALVTANRTDDPKDSARHRARGYKAIEDARARREQLQHDTIPASAAECRSDTLPKR